MLHLYDTYTRSLRAFTSLVPNQVRLYSCGPTVYDYQHIGNMRTYLMCDGLKRVLKLNAYEVQHVMNITDVGHLVGDGDEGEDKMEKGSRRTGQSAWNIAALYTDIFLQDVKALNIGMPTVLCKATDHIKEQIEFVQDIERKGFTYRTSDGIYFDTSKQANYGYLGRLDKDGLQAGSRVDIGEKRNATDYALWKFSKPEEKRQMEWPSPWGIGFPGWHIECSAMAQHFLGDYFDIHTGGEDHITVHHTNEISQTEARLSPETNNTRLANFWVHGYFLLLNNAKLSKSNNDGFLRVQLLIDKAYDPLAYRYLCMTAHYRGQLSFTWEALEAAQTALNRIRKQYFDAKIANPKPTSSSTELESLATPKGAQEFQDEFLRCLNDDLNFPKALAVFHKAWSSDLSPTEKLLFSDYADQALGLNLSNWRPAEVVVPPEIQQLAQSRWEAKTAKDWARADAIREQLNKLGWQMKDAATDFELKPL
ncbi:MAG: hypothetical protein RLZZ502_258 [Pseudomonadota bacterium]|jgi:cysteinyl-tRNA synthetase